LERQCGYEQLGGATVRLGSSVVAGGEAGHSFGKERVVGRNGGRHDGLGQARPGFPVVNDLGLVPVRTAALRCAGFVACA
jgi:hypothetical protein